MAADEISLIRDHRRIGVYGGSFDPVHHGHLAIASSVADLFSLDASLLIPAFHAPHKRRKFPTPAMDRYAMLCLATNEFPLLFVSKMEIDVPDKPFSVQTLERLKTELPNSEIFFVMGADSFMEIDTWHRWEEVLMMTSHVVVTRRGINISFDHLTPKIRERIVDLRGRAGELASHGKDHVYITDIVNADVSAAGIRQMIRDGNAGWRRDLPEEVANYIEKYQIYH